MPTPMIVTLRAYQVGFGDCLLLSVTYDRPFGVDNRDGRHMLIDFGSVRRPKGGPTLTTIAHQIHDHCDGKLDILVATHRHQDHVSGFGDEAAAPIIADLRPDLVVRPWTDAPDAPEAATGPTNLDDRSRQFASDLQATHRMAEAIHTANRSRSGNAGHLAELAAMQIPNAAAINNLETWAGGNGCYVKAGDRLKLGTTMPGVHVRVLGPPTLKQVSGLTTYAGSSDQYWFNQQAAPNLRKLAGGPTERATERALDRLAQPDGLGTARWLIDHLDSQHQAQLLGIVRSFDNALNNTSVVLLVSVGEARLLLAGDAQLENWSYTLNLIAKDRSRQLKDDLAGVDLYKVGHHGSRNATPKDLYGLWHDRLPVKPLTSVMSTMAGVYGITTETKVPRASLEAALRAQGTLYSTQTLTDRPWHELTAVLADGGQFVNV